MWAGWQGTVVLFLPVPLTHCKTLDKSPKPTLSTLAALVLASHWPE